MKKQSLTEHKPVGCFKILLWIFLSFMAITIVISIATWIFGPSKEERKERTEIRKQKAVQDSIEQIKKDSIAFINATGKLTESLKLEINSADKADFSTYRGTIEKMQLEILLFNNWRELIAKGKNSNEENIQLAQKLQEKVGKIQAREFPILRKEYVNITNKLMWEHDIEVSISSNNSEINFTGGVFAANRNKKEFQENIHSVLKQFRFKKANYRWFSGDRKNTYWNVYSGKDSDLVELDFD